jgi:hypothetical protein
VKNDNADSGELYGTETKNIIETHFRPTQRMIMLVGRVHSIPVAALDLNLPSAPRIMGAPESTRRLTRSPKRVWLAWCIYQVAGFMTHW